MYTLNPPTKIHDDMWYIGTSEDNSKYLRQDLTVQKETGYGTRHNVGFWATEELAWKAYHSYYAKHKIKKIFTTSKG